MRVGDLMDKDLTAILETCSLERAIRIMDIHRMSGLPVVDKEDHVKGFISERDIVQAALPKYMDMLADSSFLPDYGQLRKRLLAISHEPVGKYMQTDVITFNEDDSDLQVANVVLKRNIKFSPVLRDGILVGVITRAHLLGHILGDNDETSSCQDDSY